MWKERVESVLSSYELQLHHVDKELHPSRASVIKTVRDFLNNHNDFQSFSVVMASYMDKYYLFKAMWWSLYLVRCKSQLFDIIQSVICEIAKDNDIKNLRIELNEARQQLETIRHDHTQQIQQLKMSYDAKEQKIATELAETKKLLVVNMEKHDRDMAYMKGQMELLLKDQDEGVLHYIESLQGELYSRHSKV